MVALCLLSLTLLAAIAFFVGWMHRWWDLDSPFGGPSVVVAFLTSVVGGLLAAGLVVRMQRADRRLVTQAALAQPVRRLVENLESQAAGWHVVLPSQPAAYSTWDWVNYLVDVLEQAGFPPATNYSFHNPGAYELTDGEFALPGAMRSTKLFAVARTVDEIWNRHRNDTPEAFIAWRAEYVPELRKMLRVLRNMRVL